MYSIHKHNLNNSPDKLFYVSFQGGQMAVCVFILPVCYLNGKKLIYHLQNTPNTSPPAHISDTSMDTPSFASNTANIAPN